MSVSIYEIEARLYRAAQQTPIGSKWRRRDGSECEVTGHTFNLQEERVSVCYRRVAGPGFDAATETSIIYNQLL